MSPNNEEQEFLVAKTAMRFRLDRDQQKALGVKHINRAVGETIVLGSQDFQELNVPALIENGFLVPVDKEIGDQGDESENEIESSETDSGEGV